MPRNGRKALRQGGARRPGWFACALPSIVRATASAAATRRGDEWPGVQVWHGQGGPGIYMILWGGVGGLG